MLEEFEFTALAPLKHLFDDHEYCREWSKFKTKTAEGKQQAAQYYRCKDKYSKLHIQLKKQFPNLLQGKDC
eukprot:2184483-Ditylum_brightwellii.AAC.1